MSVRDLVHKCASEQAYTNNSHLLQIWIFVFRKTLIKFMQITFFEFESKSITAR